MIHFFVPSAPDIIRAAAERPELLQASQLGVPSEAMSRVERSGDIERVIPGVYIGTDHLQHRLTTAAAWTLKYPPAVIGLLTTAVYYELTDAFARGTWLHVPRGTTVPRSRTVRVNPIQTAPHLIAPTSDHTNGIISLTVHRVALRMTNPDRTVLDLWRHPRRVPEEYALDALRRRSRSPDFSIPTFARLGRRLGVWKRIAPIVQGLVLR